MIPNYCTIEKKDTTFVITCPLDHSTKAKDLQKNSSAREVDQNEDKDVRGKQQVHTSPPTKANRTSSKGLNSVIGTHDNFLNPAIGLASKKVESMTS